MKKEIKEVLECIKDKTRDYVGVNGCLYQDLDRNELNILIDYITNLQQENEEIKVENEKLTQLWLNSQEKRRKAIEYITTEQLYTNYQWGKSQYEKILKDLLNILQGVGDNE